MSALRLVAALLAIAAILLSLQRKKKTEEELTQTLEVLPDPPHAVVAETRRLVFHVSPLSPKGLLSQQVRDGLRVLQRSVSGATIVRLRAFVAGSGDLRRVQSIVSETFSERKLPLPVLSVVQVGGLPMEGAQVVLESVAAAKKEVNPAGLAFISGQAHSADRAGDPAAPLAKKALTDLSTAVKGAGSDHSDVARITCFMSTLDDLNEVRGMVAAQFPAAAANYVQIQRAPLRAIVECEAVARLKQPAPEPLKLINPTGLTASPNYSHVALISAQKVALTGTQSAFGFEDKDARLAFQRLQRDLEQVKASIKDVAMSNIYPLSASIADQVRRIRFEFYDKSHPPASTMLPFEGLPAMDAGFAVDVVAVMR